MKTLAIVQARMGSTRLPGKVMSPVLGVPMIELLLERLARAAGIDQILLATSSGEENDRLTEHVGQLGYPVYRGAEDDVLDRYYQAARLHEGDTIVRVTADCPMIDPDLVDEVVAVYKKAGVDYASNIHPPTYPDGLDVEVFGFETLKAAWQVAAKPHEREHVTPYMWQSGEFTLTNVHYQEDCSNERWTVDETEDLQLINRVFEYFDPRRDFGWRDVMALRQQQPDWFTVNNHLQRNQGIN